MSTIQVNVDNIDDLPEVAREFAVKGEDGKITVDFDKSLSALKAERSEHKADRTRLAEYTALGEVAAIKRYIDLGKTPDEIADALAKATASQAKGKGGDDEAEKQRLTIEKLTKQVDKLQAINAEREKLIADATLRKLVGGIVDALPDDINRDAVRTLVLGGKTADGADIAGSYASTFRVNALGELDDIGGKSAGEYLADFARSLGFRKSSTAGQASAGNANIPNGGVSAAFQSAKESGNIAAMIASAPTEIVKK